MDKAANRSERNIESAVKEKIDELGVTYDTLKPFMKQYLQQAESTIQDYEKAYTEASRLLQESPVNIGAIALKLNCSRATLYNHNQLLKRYIELSQEKMEKDNPYRLLSAARSKAAYLENRVTMMMDQDIDLALLKEEISILQRKDAESQNEIERLRTRVHKLSAEVHDYKIQTAKLKSGDIISLK